MLCANATFELAMNFAPFINHEREIFERKNLINFEAAFWKRIFQCELKLISRNSNELSLN